MTSARRTRAYRQRLIDDPARAKFAGQLPDGGEIWHRGSVMFVLPGIPDDAAPALKNALERRRRATLRGHCDCGARLVVEDDILSMGHESDCEAADDKILSLLEAPGGPDDAAGESRSE